MCKFFSLPLSLSLSLSLSLPLSLSLTHTYMHSHALTHSHTPLHTLYRPEDVQSIITGKLALKYAGAQVEAMQCIAKASQDRSVAEFKQVHLYSASSCIHVHCTVQMLMYTCTCRCTCLRSDVHVYMHVHNIMLLYTCHENLICTCTGLQ